jgi:hypothetical protein
MMDFEFRIQIIVGCIGGGEIFFLVLWPNLCVAEIDRSDVDER